eukprot:scaffold1130_cov195-Pinguiococcus_pyrenoidosus.AAC.102
MAEKADELKNRRGLRSQEKCVPVEEGPSRGTFASRLDAEGVTQVLADGEVVSPGTVARWVRYGASVAPRTLLCEIGHPRATRRQQGGRSFPLSRKHVVHPRLDVFVGGGVEDARSCRVDEARVHGAFVGDLHHAAPEGVPIAESAGLGRLVVMEVRREATEHNDMVASAAALEGLLGLPRRWVGRPGMQLVNRQWHVEQVGLVRLSLPAIVVDVAQPKPIERIHIGIPELHDVDAGLLGIHGPAIAQVLHGHAVRLSLAAQELAGHSQEAGTAHCRQRPSRHFGVCEIVAAGGVEPPRPGQLLVHVDLEPPADILGARGPCQEAEGGGNRQEQAQRKHLQASTPRLAPPPGLKPHFNHGGLQGSH